jgi:hypothetical protein
MLKIPTALVAVFLAVISLSLAIAARELAPSFQKCEGQYQSEGASEKQVGILSLGFQRIVAFRCTAAFVNKYNAVITAIATVLLTFVTGGLIWTGFVQIRTTRAQLRACVFPDTIGMWDGTTLNPPQPKRANIPGIVFTWKNSGQTPAANVISWAQMAVIKVADEESLIVPRLEKVFASHLGAGVIANKSLWFNRPLTADEIDGIFNGTVAVYWYGRIEYSDIFDKPRYSNFRLSYTGIFPPLPGGTFSNCKNGNHYK